MTVSAPAVVAVLLLFVAIPFPVEEEAVLGFLSPGNFDASVEVLYPLKSVSLLVVQVPHGWRPPDGAYWFPDQPVTFLLDSATVASRSRDVVNGPWGFPVNGSGVGIAVVDTGLDGSHDDFLVPGKVGGNYAVTPRGVIPAPFTAFASDHGTHVAGIAAGSGAASGGRLQGVAPGAVLFALGAGAGSTLVSVTVALDWVFENAASSSPPIRVVTNSWKCASFACMTANPDAPHVQVSSRLAESGVVVVFAVGNDGGNGSTALTSIESRNPTPGVLGVGSYDDGDAGSFNGCAAPSSSRGAVSDASSWPDLLAPGVSVESTVALLGQSASLKPHRAPNQYGKMSGTSMAAPHVAGVVALMLHADPSLQPSEVESRLKANARRLSCGLSSPNHVEGHGLVDAFSSVNGLLSTHYEGNK